VVACISKVNPFARVSIRISMPMDSCMFCLAEANPDKDFVLIGNDVCGPKHTCEPHRERGQSRLCNFCGWQSIDQDAGVGFEYLNCKDCGAGYETTYNPEQAKLLGLEPKPDIDILYDDPRYSKCWITSISNRRKKGWGELLSSR